MIATTLTFEELERRLGKIGLRTPQEIALTKLQEVAFAANKLGLDGHAISRVEIIITRSTDTMDDLISVRLVPQYRFKSTAIAKEAQS